MTPQLGLLKFRSSSNYPGRVCPSSCVTINIAIHIFLFSILAEQVSAQDKIAITLPEALETGIKNYPSIKAKTSYVNAAHALMLNARNEYLPNVIGSVQQSYGTVNG